MGIGIIAFLVWFKLYERRDKVRERRSRDEFFSGVKRPQYIESIAKEIDFRLARWEDSYDVRSPSRQRSHAKLFHEYGIDEMNQQVEVFHLATLLTQVVRNMLATPTTTRDLPLLSAGFLDRVARGCKAVNPCLSTSIAALTRLYQEIINLVQGELNSETIHRIEQENFKRFGDTALKHLLAKDRAIMTAQKSQLLALLRTVRSEWTNLSTAYSQTCTEPNKANAN